MNELKLNYYLSFFYAICFSILCYPISGTPFAYIHSYVLALMSILVFVLAIKKESKISFIILPILMFMAFFSMQTPSAYIILIILFLLILLVFFYLLIIDRNPSELPSVLINKKVPTFEAELLLENGSNLIGLGARDTLRLEAGLCLYGNDIDIKTSPIEANLKWAISKNRIESNYPGSSIIKD
ncbi:MAG: hypothetical protein QF436_04275, partial [Candidatus Woesearchaeota archaeon]|nr:hypothetical protein [Candidatus Woesearchaeota archaeon]